MISIQFYRGYWTVFVDQQPLLQFAHFDGAQTFVVESSQ